MFEVQNQGSWNFIPSNDETKSPGSYWASGQIFHSCTPNTKTTFILSPPWYFRCLKQNSPLSHPHWFSSLLLFALLLWAEQWDYYLSRRGRIAELRSNVWLLLGRSCILTRLQGRPEWIVSLKYSPLYSTKNAGTPVLVVYIEEQEKLVNKFHSWTAVPHQDFICSCYH